MRFYYGEKAWYRVLDEMEFWKNQEAEHTVVIRQVAPGLEPEYIEQLQKYELAFRQTQELAVRYMESVIRSKDNLSPAIEQQIMQLVCFAVNQSQQFVNFLNMLLDRSTAVKGNMVVMAVLHHIIRESQYFIGIAQTVLYSSKDKA